MLVRRLFACLLLTAGAAFAAPADTPAPPDLPDPPTQPRRAWFGVFFGDAVDGGVQILEVVPNGPAAKAGLASGDLVIRINGADVTARDDVGRALEGRAPGDALSMTVLRAGKPRETRVVLGSQPTPGWRVPRVTVTPVTPFPIAGEDVRASAALGIGVGEIPPELRKHYGGPSDAGVLVTRIDPKGPSAGALRVGDLVVRVADQDVAREEDLDAILTRSTSGPVAVSGFRSGAAFATKVTVALKSPEERAREARVRSIEATIRQLESQLVDLKRQLATLTARP